MTFTAIDIYHGMGPLRMFYSVTLTFTFKVKHFHVMRLLLKNVLATDTPDRFASTRTAPSVEFLFLFLAADTTYEIFANQMPKVWN